jgi:hypothetical protein
MRVLRTHSARMWRLLVAVTWLATLVAALGFGARVGSHFEYNAACCDIPPRHNALLSLEESLGLVRFPSQIGQDRWVGEKIFPDLKNGFFLDVGSGDGFENSNTWALEQKGWSGICVDAFPRNMKGRRCQVFAAVVDSAPGRRVRFKAAGEIGGIDEYLGSLRYAAEDAETVEFVTVTLDDILRRADAPPFIHYFSLDIEGAELEALRGFPFDRYGLGAIDVEHNDEEPKRTDILHLLESRGYRRVRTLYQDDLYLPR